MLDQLEIDQRVLGVQFHDGPDGQHHQRTDGDGDQHADGEGLQFGQRQDQSGDPHSQQRRAGQIKPRCGFCH